MRRAKVALSVTCRLEATGLTTGERSDAETVTLRSERGGWKRAITRWYLASRLLNLGHPLQKGECMPNLSRRLARYHLVMALRSEEHTSELQSHLNLVCRLLLEKKKNTNQ